MDERSVGKKNSPRLAVIKPCGEIDELVNKPPQCYSRYLILEAGKTSSRLLH
jgi:hypothetical protein